jgi:monofunctional biosynthetic peptidoglycan transglycosylase
MSLRTVAAAFWQKIKIIFLVLFLAQLVYIILLKWVDPPITAIQLGNWISGYGMSRDYIPMEKISPHARLAVIAAEDQLFPDHNGFDWKSIEKAMEYNQRKPGRTIRGGSTISQQVAKNVFLWNGGGYFRKALEAYFTFMIETIWGKRRILEVYLNVSEMGKGIFGIEAAAQKYFKRPATKLTKSQAAMIAACLPSPKRYTVKPLSSIVRKKYPRIEVQMTNLQTDPEIKLLLNDSESPLKKGYREREK